MRDFDGSVVSQGSVVWARGAVHISLWSCVLRVNVAGVHLK